MKNSLLYILIFLAAFASETRAENFNLTSYYPAPSGNYSTLRLAPQPAITPDTNCLIGTMYANSDNYSLPYYCTPGTPVPKFQLLPGIWTLDNNTYLYPTDTPTRTVIQLENEKVGIGTITPTFKLTLTNDGGILADNTYSTYTTLPNLGAGTRLVHYPLKHSFRAGTAAGSEWDSANLGDYSTALGYGNTASAQFSTVLGGQENTVTSVWSIIAGGKNNLSNGANSVIMGGDNNSIASTNVATGYHWVGGYDNSVICGVNNFSCGISGGRDNIISSSTGFATIGGGSQNSIVHVGASDMYSIIGGGYLNTLDGVDNTLLGGSQNTLHLSSSTTILGGYKNNSLSTLSGGTIAGGYSNTQNATANNATISGGSTNTVNANGSTVSGGSGNTASVNYSNVSGGQSNTASGSASSVLGGKSNVVSGPYSTIVGGQSNSTAGDYSLAAGRNMKLTSAADRTFLWGYSAVALASPIATPDAFLIYSGRVGIRDITPAALLEINANASNTDNYLDLTSTAAATSGDKFIVKNNGNGTANIGIGVTNPIYPLQFSSGAYVDASGNFMSASSREYKENIARLTFTQASEALSGLNPVRYNYKNEKDEEYLGFIAEDVPALVADKQREGLAPMDIAAVLTKVVQNQQKVLKEQKEESKELANEFGKLEKRMKAKGIQ